MTSKYDHIAATNYLSDLCKDGTRLRGRIALLSFRNEISAKRIDTAIMLIEYAQLLAIFLLSFTKIYPARTTNNIEIFNVLSVFAKTFSPGNLLPQDKDGLRTVQGVLEFCFASFLLRVLLFLYIIWLAWKRKTGSRLLVKSWQWIFHLQTKILFQVFVSIYSNVYEAASKDFFEFNSNQRYAYMAGCVVMSIFEFAFSIVLTTQFTSILPFKRFSASKDNYLELSILVHKFLVQYLRRLLGLPLNTSKWIYGPMNIIFSLANLYHVFQKLPVYNYQALKLQINLLIVTFTLSVATFANVALDWEKGNMNFVIITWVILSIFCIPLANACLERKLWTLAFEKGINTKRSPETLIHKIIFIKQIIASNKVPTQGSSKSHISHLIWSTFTQTSGGSLDFECQESRNKIFMHYMEDLMVAFPKNNFIKLYAAYRYARKNKLYGLSIKALADLKNSNYPTVVTSKSILKNFIEDKTQSDYQNGAYLLNLYDYCKNVADLSNMKLHMAEQAKLQWALCHEITSVGPDLAKILRLGNKANNIQRKIHKNFKKMEEGMPDYLSKPALLYAYYNLFMGYSSENYSKYKEISSKKSQKYQKQFEIDRPIPENLFQENTFIIVVSGERETAGMMNYLSPGLVETFGRNLIGSHASIITPPFIRSNAILVVKSLMEQNALTFQNTERLNYFYNIRGYMTPINYYLNINPSIYDGLSFIFICRCYNQGKEFILLNEEGEIETFTKNIGETLGLLWKDGCYDIETKTPMSQICPEFAQVNQAFNIVTTSLKKLETLGLRKSQITMQPSESPQLMTFEEAKELYHIYSEEGKDITLNPTLHGSQSNSLLYRCTIKTLMAGKKVGKILTLEKIHTNQEIVIEKENNPIEEEEETVEEDIREDVNSEWINLDRLKSEQMAMTTMSPRNLISSSRIRLMSPTKNTETNEKLLTSFNEIPTKDNLQKKKKRAKKDQPHWLKNDKIKISKLYQQALDTPYRYPFFYRGFIAALYVLFLAVFIMYSYMGVNMHSGVSELQVSKQILLKAQQRNNYIGMLDASTRFLWIYATTPASITQFFQGPILNLPTIIILNQYASGLLETVNNELFELTTSITEEQRDNLFEKDIRMFDVNSTSSLDTFISVTSFQATDRIIEASLKSYNLAFTNIQSAIPYLKFVLNNILNDMLIKNTEISGDFRVSLEDKKDSFDNWIKLCFSCSLCFLVFIVSGYIYILYLQAKHESNNLFALTKLKPQSIHNLKQDFLAFHNLVIEDDSSDPFSKIASPSLKQMNQQQQQRQRQFPIYKKLWPIYYWYFLKVVVLILILFALFLMNFVLFKKYLNRLSTKASEIYFIEQLSSRLGVIAGSFLEVTAENDATIIENMQASKALSIQISQISEMIQGISDIFSVGASYESDRVQGILYGDACAYLSDSQLLVDLCQWLGNYQEKPGLINLLSNMELSIKNLYAKFINSDRSALALLTLQVEAFNLIATPVWLIFQIENAYISMDLNANFDDIVDYSQSLNITLTIVILVAIVAESVVIHFLIVNRLREKETQFKRILGLFPANVVLPNFILKSYITKYSNQTFNSFHHEN